MDMHGSMVNPKFYTGASFGRLLALASRRLCVEAEHFEAALNAVINGSGLVLASNLQVEKVKMNYFIRKGSSTH